MDVAIVGNGTINIITLMKLELSYEKTLSHGSEVAVNHIDVVIVCV